MKLGIGIDTGGTCTDAVIYDFDKKQVIQTAKSLTTKDDLSIGMINSLKQLDYTYFKDVKLVSLSTTLATNACVEDKGGRAKIVLMNIDKKTVDWVGHKYGLSDNGELFFTSVKEEDDEKAFYDNLKNDTKEWLSDADGLGIVEIDAISNGAKYEKGFKNIIEQSYKEPIVCGYELFNELNSLKRAASTILNVKLIPIIDNFINKIKFSMNELGLECPIAIVRSDCSLMSEDFSKARPVETILCGPAASVVGGQSLSSDKNSIIVDMGGTTTDISIIRDGEPIKVKNGVSIGKWRTFVNGVFIDTFGLGGDSRVHLNRGVVEIDNRRVMPICVAAEKYKSVETQLDELLATDRHHESIGLNEFFCLIKDISDSTHYSDFEKEFCNQLKNGPVILEKAAQNVKKDIYNLNVERLENEGVILRCGVTPTDIMHLKGDFDKYDGVASKKAVKFIVRSLKMDESNDNDITKFCDIVYDLVKKKLYTNIIRILMCEKYPAIVKEGMDKQLESIISNQWEEEKKNEVGMINHIFTTDCVLVSIGAPTHIFLPDVAKALHTTCVLPENAGVTNAIGAIVCEVEITKKVLIRPINTSEGIAGYKVYTQNGTIVLDEIEDAIELAKKDVVERLHIEATLRQLKHLDEPEVYVEGSEATSADNAVVYLGTTIIGRAKGSFM